jgi:hypothetical protein
MLVSSLYAGGRGLSRLANRAAAVARGLWLKGSDRGEPGGGTEPSAVEKSQEPGEQRLGAASERNRGAGRLVSCAAAAGAAGGGMLLMVRPAGA